jgi:RNA polymerase sigma-70 factor (sigma-E family)
VLDRLGDRRSCKERSHRRRLANHTRSPVLFLPFVSRMTTFRLGASSWTAMTGDAMVVSLTTRATPEDYGTLYRAHLEPLLRFAWLLCGDRHQAEDVVAEAFARVFPQWRRGKVAEPYAYLRRAVINEVTSRGRRRVLEVREERRRSGSGRVARRFDELVAERDVVVQALRRLPLRQRAVLVLRFYDDLSEGDVAELLGLSVGTVKSHTARGLERLRAELEER